MKPKTNWPIINRIINLFVIVSLIAVTVLYFCPIKYVQVWEHPGAYYSVYHQIAPEYYWILITSLILNLITIIFSILSFANKLPKKNIKLITIFYYSLIALCIIFAILSFVSGFIYSCNYPKAF